ncbi:MAG: hypothetical protein M0R49_07355 [Limnochordia bacterium]|nr:hypothetical protein [Limnochordia bacterium]
MKNRFLGTLLLVAALVAAALISSPQALAQEALSQDRIDLFLASRTMLMEERMQPKMKVGMVLSTLGASSEISMGVRVEAKVGTQDKLRVITETTYLKDEQTMAGFLSLKFLPLGPDPIAVYIGAGAGYVNGFRYQAFAGVDITPNMFAEMRYVNLPGGLGDSGLYLATGFHFTF